MKIVKYTEDKRDEWLQLLYEADESYFTPERLAVESWDIENIKNDLVGYYDEDAEEIVALEARAKYSSIGGNTYKLYVKSSHRRKHLATVLTKICESDLRNMGCRFVVCSVDSGNIPNLLLKLKLGYDIVQVNEEIRGHKWIDLVKAL